MMRNRWIVLLLLVAIVISLCVAQRFTFTLACSSRSINCKAGDTLTAYFKVREANGQPAVGAKIHCSAFVDVPVKGVVSEVILAGVNVILSQDVVVGTTNINGEVPGLATTADSRFTLRGIRIPNFSSICKGTITLYMSCYAQKDSYKSDVKRRFVSIRC